MVLHTRQALAQIEVLPGLYFSTEKEAVEEMVGAFDGTCKFFVGYAGWSPGQLEGEIEEGGWLIATTTSEQVFTGDDEAWNQLRKLAARSAAFPWIDPKTFPKDPSAN
jgi:putative transcriptional regulator